MDDTAEKTKKKSNDQSQHDEESINSRMESLEAELIMEILSRVPTLNLLKLSSVCRRWRNILNDPLFRQLHYSRSKSNPNGNQVLVLKRRSELYWVDFSNETNPRQVAIDLPHVPNLLHYQFIGSCNGLLCFGSKAHMRIFVLNPFTRQHLFIPVPLNSDRYDNEAVWSWGFGFDEITKLFKVVVIVSSSLEMYIGLEVKVCDLGSSDHINWRSRGVTDFFRMSSSSCFVNGRLHWIYWTTKTRGIVSYDLVDEEFRPIPTPDCLELQKGVNVYLLVLQGCLCIFHSQMLETSNLQIWIMKEYGIKASWVKALDTYPLIPRSLNSHLDIPWRILKGLGFGKDGELVMSEFNMRTDVEAILFSSDSTCDEFKHLQLEVPPYLEGSIIHTASLNWI